MKLFVNGGFLLAIEGIDGAGKSTLARLVAEKLEKRGYGVVLTREPTDGPWGRRLRESAVSGRMAPADELEAFIEDRKEHVAGVIRPGLEAGQVVVTDRYYFSTVAYQGARGLDPAALLRQNEAFAPEPHLLVIVDLDPATGRARIGRRGDATDEFETVSQLSRTRAIFASIQKPYLLRLDGSATPEGNRDAVLGFFRSAVAGRTCEPHQ
ncbi:MAG: dTMP kinase [Limisphaerales bacterium]